MMPVRVLIACACLLVLAPPVAAQREADQATLVFSFAGTFSGAGDLWEVGNQPVFLGQAADTLALGRKLNSGLGLFVAGIYFPKPHFGIAGEAFFLGRGTEDSCRHTFLTGNADAATLCSSINGNSNSGTAVMVTVGPVLRFNTRKTIKPYIRLGGGLLLGGRSTVELTSRVGSAGDFFVVYDDPDPRNISGAIVGAVGFTANLGGGYQIRWEFRDNYIGFDRVNGATVRDGRAPETSLDYQHVWSFVLGIDIILERRRGRRY
jgi:hypothetical protein